MNTERIPPSSRRVAAGDKTPTKPALLITVGVTGPIRADAELPESRGAEKNRDVAGHQMVIAIVFRCDARSPPLDRNEECSLCSSRDTRWLDACSVIVGDFDVLNISRISTTLQKKFLSS